MEQQDMDLQNLPILKAIQILKNMNCQYVVITADGRQFGEILPTKKVIKRTPLYPRGTFINHYGSILEKCQVGQTVEIPIGEFEPEMLRARVCAWATTRWGKDTYKSRITNNRVFILRYL